MPTPCPVCRDIGGFHDHGRPGSKHDAHEVPRHLVLPGANERTREVQRAARA